jgi:hypothetical protein
MALRMDCRLTLPEVASARIDLAELPVHRNNTDLSWFGLMIRLAGNRGGGMGREQAHGEVLTNFGSSAATILDQIRHQLAQAARIDQIPNASPLAVGADQSGLGEGGQLRRGGAVGQLTDLGNVAGFHALRPGLDQPPVQGHTSRMTQGRETLDSHFSVHISIFREISKYARLDLVPRAGNDGFKGAE